MRLFFIGLCAYNLASVGLTLVYGEPATIYLAGAVDLSFGLGLLSTFVEHKLRNQKYWSGWDFIVFKLAFPTLVASVLTWFATSWFFEALGISASAPDSMKFSLGVILWIIFTFLIGARWEKHTDGIIQESTGRRAYP